MNGVKNEELKHSCAHLLAHAVKELYPEVKLGFGPPLEEGFYYDFGSSHFAEDDLKKIEERMRDIVKRNYPIEKSEITRVQAKMIFKNEPFKIEHLDELKEKIYSAKQGNFTDLCGGKHVKSTGEIKAFKLTKLAGAYWKGDQRNEQMQRIYGIAFSSEKELQDHIKMLEEAAKRDHRKLGRELDLFSFHEVSPGSPFFHPKGSIIILELMKFLREEYKKRGYAEVITPLIYDKALWLTSGHWNYFKENMFILNMDEREAALKPMNCPSHMLVYKSNLHSYRELPIRYADFASLHRNELAGVIGGLTRVRKFSQDDAHIFVTEDQIENEILEVIDFLKHVYNDVFKIEYRLELSTRPEKFLGDSEKWDKAEKVLADILKKKNIPYETKPGEGAFYGPKIDIHVTDALNRSWQLATIQLDFQLPERFDLTYEGPDNKKHRPVVIHRAILGTFERFLGVIIEHYAGKFPLWLSPVQVRLMTVNERNLGFAKEVCKTLSENEIRIELDDRQESIAKKVRDAQMGRSYYAVTIGDKELENKTLAVRTRDGKVSFGVKPEDFLSDLKKKIKERSNE